METNNLSWRRRLLAAWPTIVSAIVLTCSLALNVALAWRLQASKPARPIGGIQANSVMPPIPVTDSQGVRRQLRFDGDRPTVLYILAPRCEWCRRNEQNIRALALASAGRYRFVGISTDPRTSIDEYRASADLPFPLYAIASSEDALALHMEGTPQTAVVLMDGTVSAAWGGAFDGGRQAALEGYFHVKLPGLSPALPVQPTGVASPAPRNTRKMCVDDAGLHYSQGATIKDTTGRTMVCRDDQWTPAPPQ